MSTVDWIRGHASIFSTTPLCSDLIVKWINLHFHSYSWFCCLQLPPHLSYVLTVATNQKLAESSQYGYQSGHWCRWLRSTTLPLLFPHLCYVFCVTERQKQICSMELLVQKGPFLLFYPQLSYSATDLLHLLGWCMGNLGKTAVLYWESCGKKVEERNL